MSSFISRGRFGKFNAQYDAMIFNGCSLSNVIIEPPVIPGIQVYQWKKTAQQQAHPARSWP
jgi:hypothetical protein